MTDQEIRAKYQEIIKECKDELKNENIKEVHQQVPQLSWMIFLKCLDDFDKVNALKIKNHVEILPESLQWSTWTGKRDETGDFFLDKVDDLFRELGRLQPEPGKEQISLISSIFKNLPNRIRNGFRLRKIVNHISELSFKRPNEVKIFEEIYRNELFEMVKSSENEAYYYTPRAVSQLLVSLVKPDLKKEERVYDPASGFGGILIEALESMKELGDDTEFRKKLIHKTIFGQEKDVDTFLCCVVNCMVNGLTSPNLANTNTLLLHTRDISDNNQFDVIITNPTHGGDEDETVSKNLPLEYQTSDTTSHFLYFVMESLNENGRAAMIVPNGFLFSTGVGTKIKEKLLKEFNLHTIIRFPETVFEPYTPIATNILLFEKTPKTKEICYYQFKIPEKYKGRGKNPKYGKTKPPEFDDFADILDWIGHKNDVNTNAWCESVNDLVKFDDDGKITQIDLDRKNPNDKDEPIELSPHELIDTILKDEEKTLELLRDVKELIQKEIPK